MNGQNKQYYTSNNTNLKTVRANAHIVYSQYQLANYGQTNGVAKYRSESDELFNSMRVTVPNAQKQLTTVMLNFYSQLH